MSCDCRVIRQHHGAFERREAAPATTALRALITGGSRGIGRRTAELLAADGVDVVLTYRRNVDAAQAVVAGIVGKGGLARAVPLELESASDIDELFEREFADRLDILVANAAASAFRPIADYEPYHLERSWATNVRSFVQLAQRASACMPSGGRIVALSSYGSARAFPAYAAIGADKAAVESWVRHMAAEFGPRGITVNAVSGGLIDTDSFRYFYADDAMPPVATMIERLPVRRLGTTDDMAQAVRFLASPVSGYITGQVLVVDGGLTAVASPFWSDLNTNTAGEES